VRNADGFSMELDVILTSFFIEANNDPPPPALRLNAHVTYAFTFRATIWIFAALNEHCVELNLYFESFFCKVSQCHLITKTAWLFLVTLPIILIFVSFKSKILTNTDFICSCYPPLLRSNVPQNQGSVKLNMVIIFVAIPAINSKRRAIVACCGNGKCSTAFSKVLTRKNNSSSRNRNKDVKSKNSAGTIGPNVNGKVKSWQNIIL